MKRSPDPNTGSATQLMRRSWWAWGIAAVSAIAMVHPFARGAGDPPARPAVKGRIFVPASVGAQGEGGASRIGLVAIDVENGERTTILDDCSSRPRVSPDGKTVAFEREGSIWTRSVAGGDEPRKVLDLEEASAGSPPVWSSNSKQLLISPGRRSKDRDGWTFKTFRVNADGTGQTELKIPPEDGVHDWSSDGEWLLTVSNRNAKIGWQLYVMHPDGTGVRQITEGGNPFYCRFSPDGRRVLFADGTTEERRGVWVVGIDGKGKRKICTTGKTQVSPCWSPDGTRIAVAFRHFNTPENQGEHTLIEVMDLEGKQDAVFELPKGNAGDMPDWR